MNKIRRIEELNKQELEHVISPNASWHTDYRDTSYIYIGGLPLNLSEGDIVTVFSQYGEPVWLKLARDKDTGKSRGFAWLKYEDQRSCDLAVDNLSGAEILGRKLSVDHARYKKRDDEDMDEGIVRPLGEESDDEEDMSAKRIHGQQRRRSETPKMIKDRRSGERRRRRSSTRSESPSSRSRRRSETPRTIKDRSEDKRRRRRSSTRSESPENRSRRRRRHSTTDSDSSSADRRRHRKKS